ncbi:MAG: hypothetical protein RMJ98_14745 [Myxococcales bacterium]|nr:hypothetical protein [Myxococcales bacterium]
MSIGLVLLTLLPAQASAQPRDGFLNPPPAGTFITADASTGGFQLGLEHRRTLADDAGMAVLRPYGLAGIGYAEAATAADLRFLFFTFGLTGGYRYVWRNYAPEPTITVTRAYRLDLDARKASTEQGWPFGEARLRLAVPLDRLMLVANHAVRLEGAPENSYDWFHSTVHDGGMLFRFDATLFARFPSVGAIGPTVRHLNLSRQGGREGEWAFGLTGGMNLGMVRTSHPDILLLQLLLRPGDERFGIHLLRSPVFVLIAYRLTFGR